MRELLAHLPPPPEGASAFLAANLRGLPAPAR